jgi:hypothetical protein
MATNNEIVHILGVMAAAFPHFSLSEETLKVYVKMLADLPTNALEQAGSQLIAESKFFPSISEFREMAHRLTSKLSGLPTAYEAWQEAIEHCRRGDYTGYSHPLIEKAVHQIGVPYWQTMLVDQEMATRAQFIKAYETLLEMVRSDTRLLPGSRSLADQYSLGAGEQGNDE